MSLSSNPYSYERMMQQGFEKESVYDEIGQFITLPHSFILDSKGLSFHARWLFVILRYFTNRKYGYAFPSYDAIQEITGMRREMIAKSINELIRAGWLLRRKRFNNSTLYWLKIPQPPESS